MRQNKDLLSDWCKYCKPSVINYTIVRNVNKKRIDISWPVARFPVYFCVYTVLCSPCMIYNYTSERRDGKSFMPQLSRRAERATQNKYKSSRAKSHASLSLLSAVNSLRSDEWKIADLRDRLISARHSTKRQVNTLAKRFKRPANFSPRKNNVLAKFRKIRCI